MVETRSFPSSSSSAVYTTQYDRETGEGSCNCRGWINKRKDKPRSCVHVRTMEGESVQAVRARLTDTPVQSTTTVPSFVVPKPMLAIARTKGEAFETYCTDAYVLEEKLDGHRMIVRVDGITVTAWSRPRNGKAPNQRTLPDDLVVALQKLPDGIYDGELMSVSGKSWDVTRVDTPKHLVLFDVLEVLGVWTTSMTYLERRGALQVAFAHITAPSPVRLSTSVPVSWAAVEAIWAAGGEGAVLKRLDSTYQPGTRSPDWVKVKKLGHETLTITGYEAGKTGPHSTIKLRGDDGHETTVKTKNNATLDEMEADPDSFIGRRLVISYCEKTPDGSFRHGMWDHFAGDGE